jgi:nitrogen-specific signal transduction histidine kinase
MLEKEKALRGQLILSEKNAALSRLIALVAIEIQNPLQTIQNSLFFLKNEVLSPQGREILEMADSESRRTSELVIRLKETYHQKPSQAVDFDLVEI